MLVEEDDHVTVDLAVKVFFLILYKNLLLLDHGFQQNPQGLNTGVRAKISPYRSTS